MSSMYHCSDLELHEHNMLATQLKQLLPDMYAIISQVSLLHSHMLPILCRMDNILRANKIDPARVIPTAKHLARDSKSDENRSSNPSVDLTTTALSPAMKSLATTKVIKPEVKKDLTSEVDKMKHRVITHNLGTMNNYDSTICDTPSNTHKAGVSLTTQHNVTECSRLKSEETILYIPDPVHTLQEQNTGNISQKI